FDPEPPNVSTARWSKSNRWVNSPSWRRNSGLGAQTGPARAVRSRPESKSTERMTPARAAPATSSSRTATAIVVRHDTGGLWRPRIPIALLRPEIVRDSTLRRDADSGPADSGDYSAAADQACVSADSKLSK